MNRGALSRAQRLKPPGIRQMRLRENRLCPRPLFGTPTLEQKGAPRFGLRTPIEPIV